MRKLFLFAAICLALLIFIPLSNSAQNIVIKGRVTDEKGIPVSGATVSVKATTQAAMSRLYGGIHFLPGIGNGKVLGQQVAYYVIGKLL